MWKVKIMLAKLPQLNGLKNLVEETLIVSTIWKVLCHIFHMWKVQYRFSMTLKEWFKVFHETGSKCAS